MQAEIYDDLIGDDEALQESWDRICEIYEDMQSQVKSLTSEITPSATQVFKRSYKISHTLTPEL